MRHTKNGTTTSSGKMRVRILLCLIFPFLSSGCGPRELMRLGFDRVESFRTETVGLGSAKGTATVSLYNGNKKNVTFASGRIEILLNGRTIGIATLSESVTVAPGAGFTEIPIRIRFPLEGVRLLTNHILSGQSGRQKKADVRIVGSLGIDRDGRRQTVRFKRKIDEKIWNRIGESLSDAIEFRL